jgi:hypothetical protein
MRLLMLSTIVALAALRGYAYAAPHHHPKPLAVFDAKGQFVGTVIGSTLSPPFTAPIGSSDEGFTTVVRRIGSTLVEFEVNARGTGYYPPIADPVLFDSADCSGPPLVLLDPDAMISMAFGITTGTDEDLHYTILPGSPRIWHSTAFSPNGSPCQGTLLPRGFCCIAKTPPITKNLADTATLDLTALGLVPPFSIEGP